MKYIMTEEEAVYQQNYHGHFSKRLAEWAISNMVAKDQSGIKRRISTHTVDEVMSILRENGVEIKEQNIYDAWYLYHMSIADYLKSLPNDKQRSLFVEESICDPDGTEGDVLSCFEAKMCNAGVPIHWERFI